MTILFSAIADERQRRAVGARGALRLLPRQRLRVGHADVDAARAGLRRRADAEARVRTVRNPADAAS